MTVYLALQVIQDYRVCSVMTVQSWFPDPHSYPPSSNSSSGPSSPASAATPVDFLSNLRMYMEHSDDSQRCDPETDSTPPGRRDNTTPGTVKSDVPAGMGVLVCVDSKGGHFCRCVCWGRGGVLTIGHFCRYGYWDGC